MFRQPTHWIASTSVVVMALILAALATSSIQARELTFEERVKAQQAIEQVYWNHRIWPEQNHRAKPTIGEALPDAAIRAKVTSYLAASDAVAKASGRPISERQLQDEMNRMIARTKAPRVLGELFAALGNDRVAIEETLARQTLVAQLEAPERSSASSAAPSLACGAEAWVPTSTGMGVPLGREAHTAVWTGSEMIVWGGVAGAGTRLNSGGRYDPATDSWSIVSDVGAPEPRSAHTAVWTGSEMIVWGGISQAGLFQTGGRYDPATNAWTSTSLIGAPEARQIHVAVWTGTQMIVWGGATDVGVVATGGRYDPMMDAWTPTSLVSAPEARIDHTAVWLSGVMVVWGGQAGPLYVKADTGARYDPSTDTWHPTATSGAPTGRAHHTAVGTGQEMIVWGGFDDNGLTTTGGRYDPSADVWVPTTNVGVPPGCVYHSAVWTGSEMIVWGGDPVTNTGGRYAPATNTWIPTTTLGAPERRDRHTAVWTGSEMIVWGGIYSVTDFNSGGRYCPGCDDSNPCTIDAEDPVSGCTHTVSIGASCDDGNACTIQDACDATGTCVGHHVAEGTLCADGNACTTGDVCDASGTCVAGPALDCDDGNACTVDTCDAAVGCTHGSPSCDDHNACNGLETCDPLGGCQSGTPLNCNDGNACTQDSCNPALGCQNQTLDCPSNWCNIGSCDPAVGCTSTPLPAGAFCSDNNACTYPDACDGAGRCVSGPMLNCEDNNACTVDFCIPREPGGCRHELVLCIDGNPCTMDECYPAQGGCVYTPMLGVPCNDGNICTAFDACDAFGHCMGGAALNCDDHNPCTDDGCDLVAGCVHMINAAPCDDGNSCTTGDVCAGGICKGTSSVNEPHPKTVGYYQHLCEHNHSGDQLTDADATCVADTTATFDTHTVADLCAVLTNRNGNDCDDDDRFGHHPNSCDKAKAELMALALNRCRARVCDLQQIDSDCFGSHSQTVGESFQTVDGALSGADPSATTCKGAQCLAREINTGKAFEIDDFHCDRDDHHHHGGMSCHWSVPRYNDGTNAPSRYEIWRRPHGTAAFTKVATVHDTTYYVEDPDDDYDYDVIPVQ